MYKLYNGDCLEQMQNIKTGSVDLIVTDIPYGNMKGLNDEFEWDNVIPIKPMFEACARVLRPCGRCVLFSQEPLTHKLIAGAIPTLEFQYRAIWKKDRAGNRLSNASAMVGLFEDINIFYKPYDEYNTNELRPYFSQVLEFIGLHSAKQINNELGHRKAEHCFYVTEAKKAIKNKIGGAADHTTRTGSSQFSLCTEEVYKELITHFKIDKMTGFKTYAELKAINKRYETTFNLWQGKSEKSNVLEYAKEGDTIHPTQKPVCLIEDLIKTFSNPGDLVLDFTMGSGTTVEAAINTGRNVIGIELDKNYYKYAENRAKEAAQNGAFWF